MKIATYNIWNSDVGMPLRSNQIFKEIVHLKRSVFSYTYFSLILGSKPKQKCC